MCLYVHVNTHAHTHTHAPTERETWIWTLVLHTQYQCYIIYMVYIFVIENKNKRVQNGKLKKIKWFKFLWSWIKGCKTDGLTRALASLTVQNAQILTKIRVKVFLSTWIITNGWIKNFIQKCWSKKITIFGHPFTAYLLAIFFSF